MTKHIALLALLAGCEVMKTPDRIEKLEARVDELATEVSALAGKPVGGGKKHEGGDEHAEPKTAGEHGEAKEGAAAEHGKAEHGDAKGDEAKDEKGGEEDEKAETDKKDKKDKKAEAKEEPHKVVNWTYTGETGPAKWATLDKDWAACGGAQQSPIDLELRDSKPKAIKFDYKPTAASVVDGGHALEVSFEPGSKISIEDHDFDLVRLQIHTPSEHTIAGEAFPMELQLVHKDKDGKLAMIGIMYEVGESKTLDPILAKWPAKIDAAVKLKKPFDPSALLPERRGTVQYTGSLTTPPCTEGVMWNVMRRTRDVSQKHLDVLQHHYPKNARPVVPRGERVLL